MSHLHEPIEPDDDSGDEQPSTRRIADEWAGPRRPALPDPQPAPFWPPWLVQANPFYFISAMLILAGLRLAYGDVPPGSLNCWGMLASLAGYTSVMAIAAVLVVRVGRVWDDARSILVTLVLLFVAISVSLDELLQIAPDQAGALTFAGWAFAALTSEAVLRLCRIPLLWVYRGPYHATLALLFGCPLWVSPERTGLLAEETNLRLLAFPWVAAAIGLTLLPAVWQGRRANVPNPTPWRWPWYPWSLFGFLLIVCTLRTYVLTLSFGPADGWETSFGPLHWLPLGLMLATLLLEAGRQTPWLRMAALGVAGLSGAAAMLGDSPFLRLVADRLVDPQQLAAVLTVGFYALAWLRDRRADLWLVASVPLAATTLDVIHPAQTWLILGGAGVGLLAIGAWAKTPLRMLVGIGLIAYGWTVDPLDLLSPQVQTAAVAHTLLVGLMLMTVRADGRSRDTLADYAFFALSIFGLAAVVGFGGQVAAGSIFASSMVQLGYVVAVGVVAVLFGLLLDRLKSGLGVAATLGVGLGLRFGFVGLAWLFTVVRPAAVLLLLGGLGAMVAAGFITARKSRDLSSR